MPRRTTMIPAGVRRESVAAGETGTRCRVESPPRHPAAAPATVSQCGPLETPLSGIDGREGERSRLTSPETGLRTARDALHSARLEPAKRETLRREDQRSVGSS